MESTVQDDLNACVKRHDSHPNIMVTGDSTPDDCHRTAQGALNRVRRSLTGTTAAGWYLSLVIHSCGYATATAVFAWLGLSLLPVEPTPELPQIQASLAEESILDDLPALEIVQAPGPDNEGTSESLEQLASQLAVSDRGNIDTVVNDAKIAAMGSEETEPTDQGDTQFFRIPESGLAVTKGSFTAWTDPAHPKPGDFYQIIIEMRLPDRLTRYRLTDLSGRVVGTDGYSQRLPFDQRKANAARVTGGAEPVTVKRNTVVELLGNKLQLAIKVPGARRLVKDRIFIKSRRLREEQEIKLVFGSTAGSPATSDSENDE